MYIKDYYASIELELINFTILSNFISKLPMIVTLKRYAHELKAFLKC